MTDELADGLALERIDQWQRGFEERAAQGYTQAKIGGYCHLNLGEEATVVGLTAAMQSFGWRGPEDFVAGPRDMSA